MYIDRSMPACIVFSLYGLHGLWEQTSSSVYMKLGLEIATNSATRQGRRNRPGLREDLHRGHFLFPEGHSMAIEYPEGRRRWGACLQGRRCGIQDVQSHVQCVKKTPLRKSRGIRMFSFSGKRVKTPCGLAIHIPLNKNKNLDKESGMKSMDLFAYRIRCISH